MLEGGGGGSGYACFLEYYFKQQFSALYSMYLDKILSLANNNFKVCTSIKFTGNTTPCEKFSTPSEKFLSPKNFLISLSLNFEKLTASP